VPTTTAVRPVRATTAADLAAVYKLPEPPTDPAGVAGWECEVRRAAYCANPVRLAGRIDQAWHLIAAGLRGGKGISESVSKDPRQFVTFTAPWFGPGPHPPHPARQSDLAARTTPSRSASTAGRRPAEGPKTRACRWPDP
jgi:hypothetical protein